MLFLHKYLICCVRSQFHIMHLQLLILSTIFSSLDTPSGSKPPRGLASRSHSDTSHSVGLLWMSDRLVAETSV